MYKLENGRKTIRLPNNKVRAFVRILMRKHKRHTIEDETSIPD